MNKTFKNDFEKKMVNLMIRTAALLLLLLTAVSFSTSVRSHAGVIASGSCGTNATWSLDDTGVMTISGTGEMEDYRYSYGWASGDPWNEVADQVKKIIVENGITKIGDCAFLNCKNVVEIEIGESVNSIGQNAFSGDKYKSVILPINAKLGEWAFSDGESLEKVKIIGSGAGITYANNEYSLDTYYRYTPWSRASEHEHEVEVEISEGITEISEYMFYNCAYLTKIIIPKSVKKIGKYAFYNCRRVSEGLFVPDGMTEIGDYTFYNCESMTGHLVIPDSVKSIGTCAFYGWSRINKLTMPATAKIKGSGTFGNMAALKNIRLTGTGEMQNYINSTDDIYYTYYQYTPWYSASENENELEIVVDEGITSIGDFAFSDCEYLTNITLPSTIKNIGKYAFNDCKRLKGDIIIPSGMTEIGECTFRYCESLSGDLVIPDTVKKIKSSAFYGICRVSKVTMPAQAILESSAFGNMKALKYVKLTGKGNMIEISNSTSHPVNVAYYEHTPWYSASQNENEIEIEISDGVTSISEYAFMNCKYITKVTIPASIKEIGKWAFYNNDLLTAINYGGSEKQWKDIDIAENNQFDSTKIEYDSKGSKSDYDQGKIELSETKKTINSGDEFTLELNNASGKVTWKSSNAKVAKVKNGVVTAVGAGTATITATNNGTKYKCKVTVAGEVGLNYTEKTIKVGETLKLKVSGANAVSFTSSKKSVAKVKTSGTVVAKKAGKTTIKIKCDNGKTYTCKVTVKK